MSENHAEDPSWLRFGHVSKFLNFPVSTNISQTVLLTGFETKALAVAREMKIYEPTTVIRKTNRFANDASMWEKQKRNYQRTWIFLFLMDKSFGTTLGRVPCVSWKELPADLNGWSQAPVACPSDRITLGIVQARVTVVNSIPPAFVMNSLLILHTRLEPWIDFEDWPERRQPLLSGTNRRNLSLKSFELTRPQGQGRAPTCRFCSFTSNTTTSWCIRTPSGRLQLLRMSIRIRWTPFLITYSRLGVDSCSSPPKTHHC